MTRFTTTHSRPEPRRAFLRTVTVGAVLVGCAAGPQAKGAKASSGEGDSGDAEVTPGEDLMQEHGVLERILLVYEEAVRRVEHSEAFDPSVVVSAADIVRRFVEDYHERNEEQFVFPRLEAAKKESELVALLRLQHQRGRDVTDRIVKAAQSPKPAEVAPLLRAFVRMYRPHAAREDTVLFPAFRSVIGKSGYRELGEKFEDQEHARFGEHGFEETVQRVAALESALEIGDLGSFTP